MDWFQYIPLLVQYAPVAKGVLDEAASNDDATTKLRKLLPSVVPILEKVGAQLFPKAASAIHLVGGAMAAYDGNIVRWVQGACNSIVTPSPGLRVDGIYGPRTAAAVEQLQAKLGLKVDGLAGQITQGAIAYALAHLK